MNNADSGKLDASASGMLDLLLKAAAHQSVNICGVALDALTELAAKDETFALRLLPILQHRAIVPHVLDSGNPSLAASEVCGVDTFEFESFRSTVLNVALKSCYRKNEDYYMNSCSVAVEEFCKAAPTVKTSFQLEAALYCLGAVADESIAGGQARLTKEFIAENASSDMSNTKKNQLARCTQLLEMKPVCMTANPLTLSQACRFIGKVSIFRWGSICNRFGSVFLLLFDSLIACKVVCRERERRGYGHCSRTMPLGNGGIASVD